MKINYILVDYENIQPKSIDALDDIPFKAKIFLGANQSKLPLGLVQSLQKFGERVEYIQIEGAGRNVLDFHICYYLGMLANQDHNGYFHIISKDTGFDIVVKHLNLQKISCQRSSSIEDIPRLIKEQMG